MITMTIATLHRPIAFESMPGVQRGNICSQICHWETLYVSCVKSESYWKYVCGVHCFFLESLEHILNYAVLV